MKSLIAFAECVLQDMGTYCSLSTGSDFKTIRDRVEHEGLSFLTITLPNFAQDFERALDQGFVGSNQFLGFSRGSGGLPLFLGGFLCQVFDKKSGVLLDAPSIAAIYAIRQITRLFGKLGIKCSDKRERDAFRRYIDKEEQLVSLSSRLESESVWLQRRVEYRAMSRMLWGRMFDRIDQRIYNGEIVPKHSGGSTADRILSNRKYTSLEWTQRLDEIFPATDYLIPNFHFIPDLEDTSLLDPGSEVPVKVTAVPKTLKTPRIIAMEPTCMQYMQQGILEMIVDEMRKDDNSSYFVLNDSQEPNQRLAKIGSIDGSLATLDLKDASDSVLNLHVLDLTFANYWLRTSLQATRSTKADVRGQIIHLTKFASMGSATCFPMEAFVFATIVFLGIQEACNHRLTPADIRRLRGKVRVYGDDIIVPVEYVESVVSKLETFGFKVNSNKSFWTGKFRESCGKEYYGGCDVGIHRITHLFPVQRADIEEIVSTVSLRNRLAYRQYELFSRSVAFLDNMLVGLLAYFPEVTPRSQILGRWTDYPDLTQCKWSTDLHIPLVRGCIAKSELPKNELGGRGALMKHFLKRSETPFEDVNHLKRSGRSRYVSIKSVWLPV